MQNTELINKFIPIIFNAKFLSFIACIHKMQKSEGVALHRLISMAEKSLHKQNQLVKSFFNFCLQQLIPILNILQFQIQIDEK